MKINTRQLTQMAMLAAVSIVLVYFIHFPIFPSAPFLEYDPADITLIMGALLYGPAAGLILTAVVCIVQGFTVSAQSGVIGIVMHFAATGAYVLVAGLLYKRFRTTHGAALAMLAGFAAMCSTMMLWNIAFTPIFMGVPRQAVIDMLLPVILPFNAIKAGANSLVAFYLFGALSPFLQRMLKREV
jgi:riboflavin transporter FmnP